MAFSILKTVAKSGEKGMTCEEALNSLGVPYQQGSKRFFNLAAVQCLVPKGRRATSAGATATYYVVPDDVHFVSYLALEHGSKGRKNTGLNALERQALAAAMSFIRAWNGAITSQQRELITTKLVKTLLGLTVNQVKQQTSAT